MNYNEAAAFCETKGATLMIPRSREEFNLIPQICGHSFCEVYVSYSLNRGKKHFNI